MNSPFKPEQEDLMKKEQKEFRVLGRMLAEEITAEELQQVAGGKLKGTLTYPGPVVDVGP